MSQIYTKHNVVHVDPDIAPGNVLLLLGSPCHTVTPYDVYARYIAKDARICFMRAGIPAAIHICHRRRASVGHGSGPGGSVRFGDDMIPPDVQAEVSFQALPAAREAWDAYRYRRFLRKPFSIAGDLVWRDDAWQRGNVGAYVRANALFIANAIRRPPEVIARIEELIKKRTPHEDNPTPAEILDAQ